MAYVLSSVSGNLISAASAGYAPTNSADVSAIASAYQVVSSTATQLYAGTAYVTSVNEAPVSAARAGNAANASLANSAYYDGTGRLISALPDSAAVSAIASSYVESGVSSKQDTLSFAYNTADQISSINGSALGGMDEAAVSGIASSYAESAASSKLDSSAQVVSSLQYQTHPSTATSTMSFWERGVGFYMLSAANFPPDKTDVLSINLTADVNGAAYEMYLHGSSISAVAVEKTAATSKSPWEWNDVFPVSRGLETGYDEDLGTVTAYTPIGFNPGWPTGDYLFFLASGTPYTSKPLNFMVNFYPDNSAVLEYKDRDNMLSAVSGVNELPLYLPIYDDVSAIASAYTESALNLVANNYPQFGSCSAIASDYAESAVSSVSGNYYTTANESGFLTAQAQASWSESASASPSYIQDKPDLVDIVAGPGIVVDNPDGNTLRVSSEYDVETVLFNGTAASSVTCSESVSNFTRLRVYVKATSFATLHEVEFDVADSSVGYFFMANAQNGYGSQIGVSSTTVALSGNRHVWFNDMSIGSESAQIVITKIVGIHRIANN